MAESVGNQNPDRVSESVWVKVPETVGEEPLPVPKLDGQPALDELPTKWSGEHTEPLLRVVGKPVLAFFVDDAGR